MKNRSLINPSKNGIINNNQRVYVSKNEIHELAQAVKNTLITNGIKFEAKQSICKERSPEISVNSGPLGHKIKVGITWKTTTIIKFTPK